MSILYNGSKIGYLFIFVPICIFVTGIYHAVKIDAVRRYNK